jgi:hypothetical protein
MPKTAIPTHLNVTLSEAKGLYLTRVRFFASLRMTIEQPQAAIC